MIRETSKNAFKASTTQRITQAEVIFNLIEERGPMSINQIARELHMIPGRVSARISDLRDKKKMVREGKLITDEVTGVQNISWEVGEPVEQNTIETSIIFYGADQEPTEQDRNYLIQIKTTGEESKLIHAIWTNGFFFVGNVMFTLSQIDRWSLLPNKL